MTSSKRVLTLAAGAFAAAGALSALRRLSAAGEIGALRRGGAGEPADDYGAHGFVRRSVETPAGEMIYHESGEGRPLVFVHGIGGGASSWVWSKVAPAFAGRYRVVVPDWVGWGESEHPRRLVLFDDYVAGLRALLQDGVGKPAVVVAQSLATGFAAELTRTDPGLIDGLVMLTPSGGKDFGRDAFGPIARSTLTPVARRHPFNLLLYRLVFHSRSFIRSWLVSQGFYDPGAVSREIVDGFLWSARRPGAAYSALPFLSGDLRFDLAPYLRDLAVPAAMIWGSEERQVGRETGEKLAALNPDVSLTFINRTRATPELEKPAQTIAAIEAALQGLSWNRRALRRRSRGGRGEEGGRANVREGVKEARASDETGEAHRLLEPLSRRLDEAHDAGEAALKLGPEDLRELCCRAGVEGDAAGAFRLLVRSNLVRLRGRWREGVSGETAPVYVSRVVESGGSGRSTELREGERSGKTGSSGRKGGR